MLLVLYGNLVHAVDPVDDGRSGDGDKVQEQVPREAVAEPVKPSSSQTSSEYGRFYLTSDNRARTGHVETGFSRSRF